MRNLCCGLVKLENPRLVISLSCLLSRNFSCMFRQRTRGRFWLEFCMLSTIFVLSTIFSCCPQYFFLQFFMLSTIFFLQFYMLSTILHASCNQSLVACFARELAAGFGCVFQVVCCMFSGYFGCMFRQETRRRFTRPAR